jgi:hypothetical protein
MSEIRGQKSAGREKRAKSEEQRQRAEVGDQNSADLFNQDTNANPPFLTADL